MHVDFVGDRIHRHGDRIGSHRGLRRLRSGAGSRVRGAGCQQGMNQKATNPHGMRWLHDGRLWRDSQSLSRLGADGSAVLPERPPGCKTQRQG